MAEYVIKARNFQGSIIQEFVQAENQSTVVQRLLAKKYIILDIRPKQKNFLNADLFEKFGRIKPAIFINFVKEFAFLLKSGISVFQCLAILVEQAKDKRFKKQLLEIRQDLSEGKTLSQGMKRFPKTFSNLFINMIRVGERGGSIVHALENVKDYLEKENRIKAKIRSAMTYPILMLLVSVAVMIVMFTFVIPRFVEIFTEVGLELPATTRFLIRLSEFFQGNVSFIIAGMLLLIAAPRLLLKWPAGRWFWDKQKFRIPVFGNLIKKFLLIRFTRTLGILLKSGVPILDALTITRDVSANVVIEGQINGAIKEIRDGKRLTRALEKVRLLPSFVIETVAVGEKSGMIHDILLDVADHYNFELEEDSKRLTSLLEPIMLMVIGLVVLFIAMSVILPMFNISSNFRQHGV